VVAAQPNVSEAELDKSILNHALMNGALELLPQSWASMAGGLFGTLLYQWAGAS
jgi:hypothetical protein